METSDGPNLYSPFKLRFFPFVADGNDEEARKFRFRRGNNWVKIKPGDLPWKSWWSLKRNEGGGEREREVKVHSTSTHRSCGSHDDAIALGWNIFSFFFFYYSWIQTGKPSPHHHPHTFLDVFKRDGVSNRADIEHGTRCKLIFIGFQRKSFLYGANGTTLRGNFKKRNSEREDVSEGERALTLNRHLVGEEGR